MVRKKNSVSASVAVETRESARKGALAACTRSPRAGLEYPTAGQPARARGDEAAGSGRAAYTGILSCDENILTLNMRKIENSR